MARTRDDELFDAQRDRILAAAAACFVAQGFHAASIADICAAAGGISPGRLYHYFPSKQAIIEAFAAEERGAVADLFAKATRAKNGREGLLGFVRQSVARAIEGDYAALAMEVVSEATRNAEVKAIVDAAEDEYRARLVDLLGRARGTTGRTLSPAEHAPVARAITAIIDGMTVRALLEPAARRKLPREAEALAALLLDEPGPAPRRRSFRP